MNIRFDNKHSITQFHFSDEIEFKDSLKDKRISDNLYFFPYPASSNYIKQFIQSQAHSKTSFAIRNALGHFIGLLLLNPGFQPKDIHNTHRATLWFYLSEKYRGKGLMTNYLSKFSEYAFTELGLRRIAAFLPEDNTAACKSLERAGFRLEGTLFDDFQKNGQFINGRIYAKIKRNPK